MGKSARQLTISIILTLLATQMSGASPLAMHRAVMAYDRTVSQVESKMLLLNIARARHHRPLHFTAVSSVAATFDFRSNAGITGELFQGVFAGAPQGFTKNFYTFNLGVSVSENPTVNIIPIQGEDCTKRILAPMDEAKLGFLLHRGVNPAMLLRLMTEAILVERQGEDIVTVLPNHPSHIDGYSEFRRRVSHLSALYLQHLLHVAPLRFEEPWPLPLDHVLTEQALNKGYRLIHIDLRQPPALSRQVTGRLAITNYDPSRLSNQEQRRLQEDALRYPDDYILVDIRPGNPGGDYPFHGRIQLRSFQAALAFWAEGIVEWPEFSVEPDPRTGPIPANPAQTIEVVEAESPPPDSAFAVEYDA